MRKLGFFNSSPDGRQFKSGHPALLPSERSSYVTNLQSALPQLYSEYMDRLSDRHGTLQCRFLENASSSRFILFRP